MLRLRQILTCALLFVLIGLAVHVVLLVVAATALVRASTVVVATVPDQVNAVRSDLNAQIAYTRADVLRAVNQQVGGLRHDAVSQINGIRADANARLADTLSRVDAALGTVDALSADVSPALANVASLAGRANDIAAHIDAALPDFTDCAFLDADGTPIGGNPDCAFNRFQGASKAIEQAAVNVSSMTKSTSAAIPEILSNTQKATDAAAAASEQTRLLAKNLADASKPLPVYVRIPLQLLGLISPIASGAVTSLAATGVIH